MKQLFSGMCADHNCSSIAAFFVFYSVLFVLYGICRHIGVIDEWWICVQYQVDVNILGGQPGWLHARLDPPPEMDSRAAAKYESDKG